MTPETATLVAAVLAAFASILGLFVSSLQKRGEEVRAATRLAAAKNLDEVGRLIHETVALSFIQTKANSEANYKDKLTKANQVASKLKDKRLDVRYSLWGIDEGLRTLTRLPSWLDHTRDEPTRRDQILQRGRELGFALDGAIRGTFLTGALPGHWGRYRVSRASKRMRLEFDASSRRSSLDEVADE